MTVVLGANLKRGTTRSCGCLALEVWAANPVKHGLEGTHVYRAWQRMKARCTDQRRDAYKHYGGRGITVCSQWRDNFLAFYEHVGRPPSRSHSLERVDVNGNYEPGNVTWATPKEQCNNRRSNRVIVFRGQRKTLAMWAEHMGVGSSTLGYRLNRGWPVERALTEPVRRGNATD